MIKICGSWRMHYFTRLRRSHQPSRQSCWGFLIRSLASFSFWVLPVALISVGYYCAEASRLELNGSFTASSRKSVAKGAEK
jgi:hypothetical protein